jgi:hypothetical protein
MNLKNNIRTALVAFVSLSGCLQAQTVNLINNIVPSYLNGGTTLLKNNTEYYIGTFGISDAATISGYFGGDTAANYNALFSNFSILASFRDADGGEAARIFQPEAGETETSLVYAFNGNREPGWFNNKPMQVVILSPLDGQNSPGNILQLGVYTAYDFAAAAAVNFVTSDNTDINSLALDTQDNATGSAVLVGANAILGSGGPAGSTSFTLSTITVPEPSSASLMLLGAAGVLALRRLRKNNV